MKMVTTKAMAKVAAVATGLAMATSMLSFASVANAALTASQVSAIISLLQSFGADSTTIANVQASLTGGTPAPTPGNSSCAFSRDLTVGSTGADVTCLQAALIGMGYSIPAGATGYFGAQTVAAVKAWQTAKGVSPAAGYFGAISRAAFGGTVVVNPGTPAPAGNGLGIKLSATSPNGTVLVQGQGIGNLADYVFSNPTSAPITVTALSFKRIGVSNDATMTNVYLYNGAMRLTDSAGVSSSAFSYSDPSGIFTVPAGMTYTVSVRSDIADSTSGQQIGVQLVSVSSSGTLDSSVVFPINSGLQTISAATLADVVFNATTLPTTNTSLVPANDILVWQNTVAVSTNPVKLSSIRLTNLGSIDSSNVVNLRLFVDGTMVGSAVPVMNADRTVTFDLSANPTLLSTQSHIIKVLANITGGSSRTLQLSVQRSSDAMFVDNQLGQPVTLNTTNNSTAFSAATSGLQTIAAVTASSGVSVSLAPDSPTASVPVGASNVKWASFNMLASGENVKVMDLFVVASSSVSGVISGVGGLNNGRVMVNGVQIGSTKDINAGTSATAAGSATDFSLGSSLILPAGVTTKVDIYADAQDTAGTNLANGASVVVSLVAGSSNGQGQSSLVSTNVPSSVVSTNAVTVTSSSLTATKYTGYGNQTVIAGSNNAKIGAFTLSTGSTEGVNVNTIEITMSTANAASITNLTLKDNATGSTLGTIITTPTASNSFSVSYAVPASSTKVIDIYANVLSGANAGSIVTSVGASTAGTGMITSISASPSATALQTITVGSGTLSVTRGAGDPTSNNVLAGAASVAVGEFNFAASNSAYTVNNLAILVPNSAATSVTNVTVSYKNQAGATVTATQALAVSALMPFATATFTGLGMYVPMNDSADLDVMVGTPTIASGATSGAAINVSLNTGNSSTAIDSTFVANDSAGTTLTVVNSGTDIASNGTFYVRKSIPTFAMNSVSGASIPTPLYQFTITADPAGAVEWTKLVFTVGTTSATITGVDLVDNATGVSILDNNTSSASTTATAITVDLTKNATKATFAQVSAGSSKTYNLTGTVAGFTTGSTISIRLAADNSATANAAAGSVSGNTVWSDRSATTHTISTSDWTNGYLLRNFTTNSVTYSK